MARHSSLSSSKVGGVLAQDRRLSISPIQIFLTCGYAYTTKLIDPLVNIGELYQSVRAYFSRCIFYRVVENKAYRHRISVTSPGYSNPQKAAMPNSVLQLAQVR